MSTKSQRRQAALMGSIFVIDYGPKELRDCTVDEIAFVLDQLVDAVEQQAAELRGAVSDPDVDEAVMDELANSLLGDVEDLRDIFSHRESLRR